MTNHSRTALLVAGMHRSGTSVLARVLNLLGASLGHSFIPPKSDNERGFWENREFLKLHEDFLAHHGCRWHDPVLLPKGWQTDAKAVQFQAQLDSLIDEQFGKNALFAVKDPRLSFLAPLWLPVLVRRGIRPAFILTIRHPAAVAASLAKRDGFSQAHSNLLWLQHMVEAEEVSRFHGRAFVEYDALLADWRNTIKSTGNALGLRWKFDTNEVERKIDAYVDPSLRHHGNADTPDDVYPLPELLEQVYTWMCSCTRGKTDINYFDLLKNQYSHVMSIGGARCLELSKSSVIDRAAHLEELSRAREIIDQKQVEIRRAQQTIDNLAQELRVARTRHDTLANENDQAREAIADKEQQIEQARSSIDSLQEQVNRARTAHQSRDAIENNLRDRIRSMRQSPFFRAGLLKETREIRKLRQCERKRVAELARAKSHIDALVCEVDRARANIDSLVAEIDLARQAHKARDVVEQALRDEVLRLQQAQPPECTPDSTPTRSSMGNTEPQSDHGSP